MIRTLLLVGTGGFLGSISRYLVSRFVQNSIPSSFPYGTFFVNIAGCLLIGIIYGLSERSSLLTPGWRLFLAAGFCGGFLLLLSLYRIKCIPGNISYFFGSVNNKNILKL